MANSPDADRPAGSAPDSVVPPSSAESRRLGPSLATGPQDLADSQAGRTVDSASTADIERRVDFPHRTGFSSSSPAAEEIPELLKPPASDADEVSSAANAPRTGREEELLLQASQIAEHLRAQFAELDRREQSLNEQLTLLDQERRNVRLWAHQYEEQMLDREDKLRRQESDFTQKLKECEHLVGDLEEQEKDLLKFRDKVEAQRASLKEGVQRELGAQRADIETARRDLEARQEQLAAEDERQRMEHDRAVQAVREQVESERETLRSQLLAELQEERDRFGREKMEWEAHREAQLIDIRTQREFNETTLAQVEQELENGRCEHAAKLEQREREQQQLLADELRKFEQELDRQNEEWTTRRDAELGEIERKRAAEENRLSELRAELESQYRQKTQEWEQGRDRQQLQLEQRVREQQQKLDRETAQFEQQRRIFDSRIRFQQDHLAKTREELETAQREFGRERQQSQFLLEQSETLIRLRGNQLAHFRALLEERELSLVREQELLCESRQSFETEANQDRQRLRQERREWEETQQSQLAEIRRQKDLLAAHSENLDSRRARLDRLRSELEETHRRTLEMRMSVEEVWAEVSQTIGDDAAKHRVEQAREAISEHDSQSRQTLQKERDNLAEAQAALKRQRDELAGERRKLTEATEEREQRLHESETKLAEDAESMETREGAWRAARERWTLEKIEAERVIRDLLSQINDANSTDSHAMPTAGHAVTPVPRTGDSPPQPSPPQPSPPHWIDGNRHHRLGGNVRDAGATK